MLENEKIKIYVSAEVEAIINKDAEGFEFFKSNGIDLNKNALLTRLIVNYSERFHEKQEEMIDYMGEALASAGMKSGNALLTLCAKMSERIQSMSSPLTRGKFDRPISIKPTKLSFPIISYIEASCLYGASLSEHFRNMLSSYASLPQDEREKIIFKDEYDAISRAIENKKRVFIVTKNKGSSFIISPYKITSSKEELHTYVLAGNEKGASPVRLSRIMSVRVLNEEAVFTPEQIEIFEKMVKYGPQFIYNKNDGEAIVELTRKGVEKFRKLYVHRPVPDKVEGNRYYFSCSHFQLFQYFVRFGDDAYVVSPKKLRGDILHYYKRGVKYIYTRQDSENN